MMSMVSMMPAFLTVLQVWALVGQLVVELANHWGSVQVVAVMVGVMMTGAGLMMTVSVRWFAVRCRFVMVRMSVMAVVVRWFGGVKLGKGGLARAYAAAVREALQRRAEQPLGLRAGQIGDPVDKSMSTGPAPFSAIDQPPEGRFMANQECARLGCVTTWPVAMSTIAGTVMPFE